MALSYFFFFCLHLSKSFIYGSYMGQLFLKQGSVVSDRTSIKTLGEGGAGENGGGQKI